MKKTTYAEVRVVIGAKCPYCKRWTEGEADSMPELDDTYDEQCVHCGKLYQIDFKEDK